MLRKLCASFKKNKKKATLVPPKSEVKSRFQMAAGGTGMGCCDRRFSPASPLTVDWDVKKEGEADPLWSRDKNPGQLDVT